MRQKISATPLPSLCRSGVAAAVNWNHFDWEMFAYALQRQKLATTSSEFSHLFGKIHCVVFLITQPASCASRGKVLFFFHVFTSGKKYTCSKY